MPEKSMSEILVKGLLSKLHDFKVVAERMPPPRSKAEYEPLTERQFVRKFGDKVKTVRYSGRPDFVGLMVCGTSIGFIITKDKSGRKLRLIDVDAQGNRHVTKRFIRLKHKDSASFLWRGLLNYVQ